MGCKEICDADGDVDGDDFFSFVFLFYARIIAENAL